jgi:hypothetical protein
MQLELTETERRELTVLVKAAYGDINPEIHHARDRQFREDLRERRTVLAELLKRLETA